jgi:hypothetical protein
MAESETPFESLKRMGASPVRYYIATESLTQPLKKHAIDWLAQLDDAERERNEASQASQIRTALSAKTAAWIAAIAAIIASVLTIISIVISYLSWKS